MRQLVPNLILENYANGIYRGDFPAVGLFVDISGFSTMTDSLMQHGQHGAEVLARIMRRVFGLPSQSIYEQGGFIVGYAGDAFTALFPLTDDRPGAIRRAIAAAWAIQRQMEAEPIHTTEYGVFSISVKIGLALGDTSWGVLRSRDGQRATYYFQGAAINDSASAEHRAKAGEIILAPSLGELALDLVTIGLLADGYYRLIAVDVLPAPHPIISLLSYPEAMKAFFPESLLHQNISSEFRQAINLFLSLPNLPTEALDAFLKSVFELQALYGGLFTRVDFGDKGCNILLFWGAPLAFENDIERALNFLLELKTQAGFQFTAGVTYYISRAGFMGSDLMEEYTCYGWGINLAARLMLSAPRGDAWLDERVARRAGRHFEIDFIGEQNFKGFAQKQKVFSLCGRKETSAAFFQGSLVGRENELQALTEFVAPLWNGQYAGSLTVWGDPGMGKSRLLYEFQVSPLFVERQAVWAFCQSDQILRESFNPFSYWLRHYFDLSRAQNETQKKSNLHLKLKGLIDSTSDAALVEDLNRADSFLAALVDLSWPDSLYAQMDARARYDNTFIALTALIKAESLRQPLILFIEDAQYLDDDSLAFLRSLLRSLKAGSSVYPVAIISTSRREGAALPLDPILLEQEIDLARLSSPSLTQLAEIILGNPPAGNLLQLLEERADGNPFFAEQILHYLQEESLLRRGENGWDMIETRGESTLPMDIKTVLISRLDRLTREVRGVIQTASVLGREFEVQVLAHMLRDDTSLTDEIQEAEKAAIWLALNEIRYIFKHALLRDAAYTMQMQARRQELHALAVDALENVFVGRLETHFGELAYHAEQANLVEKARQYLEQAGDRARNDFQNTAAADYYTRALALTPADDLESQYRLRLWLDDVYDQLGSREVQKQNLEQIRQLAVTTNDIRKLAEVSKLETLYLSFLGEHSQAIKSARKTITLAHQTGDKEIAMRAYAYWVTSLHYLGRNVEAVEYAEVGLQLAREIGHLSGEAQQLNVYGLIALKLRDPEMARARFERSLEIYQQIGNLRGQVNPLANLGWVYFHLGNYAKTQDYFEKALVNAREVGHRTAEAQLFGKVGWILGLQGDFERATTYLMRGLRLVRETAHRQGELYILLNLSAYSETLGKVESALDYAAQALTLARELNDRPGEAWSHNYRGHALLALGRITEAQTAYHAALELDQALNLPVEATEPAAGLARIALGYRDLTSAQQCIDLVLVQIEQDRSLSGTDQPLRVYQTCYSVLRATQNERAKSVLEMAHQLLLARLNNITDETLQSTFLENIPYHREILREWRANQNGAQSQ